MIFKRAGVTPLAGMALAAPAAASANEDPAGSLSCPQAERAEQAAAALDARISAFDRQMGQLDERLAALDEILANQEALRTEALEEAKAKVEDLARRSELSPEQIDAGVAAVIAQAEAKGRAIADAEAAAKRAMEAIHAQMVLLHQQMQALQSLGSASPVSAGAGHG